MNILIFYFTIIIIPAKIMMKQIDNLFKKDEHKTSFKKVRLIGICVFSLLLNLYLWESMLSALYFHTAAKELGVYIYTSEQLIIRGFANLSFALWAPRILYNVLIWFKSKKKTGD